MRPRPSGARIIEEQYRLFKQAQDAVRAEGFDQIVELHEEDLNSVRIEILYRPINPLVSNSDPKNRRNSPPSSKDSEPRC